MLLPSAALVIALVIVVQRFKTFDPLTAVLFLLSAVSLSLLQASTRSCLRVLSSCLSDYCRIPGAATSFCSCGVDRLLCNICCAGICTEFCLLWRPYLADSRTLEARRRSGRSSHLLEQSLRSYLPSGPTPVTLATLVRLPWDLAVTLHPGAFHHVLGLGVFGFLFALRERGSGATTAAHRAACICTGVCLRAAQPWPSLFSRTRTLWWRGSSCSGPLASA